MDPLHWQRIEQVFDAARVLRREDRDAFLRESCGADEGLREQVVALLDADEAAGFEPPETRELEASLAGAPQVGRRVGPYELVRELGRGGMATVYLARRVDEHFEKEVALKLIRRGMDTEDIVDRFRQERQVLAGLEHAGIARLLDGGTTDDGLPFLVMQYVAGVPLDVYCDAQRLGVRQRVELIKRVCDAVQHAHEAGVVHRDLKPNNVLVTAGGDPRLLDFGIARLLDPGGAVATADITATEQRLMTPEYASPEQVLGRRVSAATDVYSLGVMLFRSLTGQSPYGDPAARGDLVLRVCDDDPPRASECAARAGAEVTTRRGDSATRLQRELAGDLDNVIAMALRKEPERRYHSAGALGDDLAHWLQSEPVLARPSTWTYRSQKFVRRHRALVGATIAVVATLVAGLAISLALYLESERLRAAAGHGTYVAHVAAAAGSLRGGDPADARRNLLLAPEEYRGWEWRHLWARSDSSAQTLASEVETHLQVGWSADGERLASVGLEGSLVVWERASGEVLRSWEGLGDRCLSLALTPDGKRVVITSETGGVHALDVDSGDTIWTRPGGRGHVRLDSDGTALLYADSSSLRLLAMATGEERAVLERAGSTFLGCVFDERRGRVLFATKKGVLGEWMPASGDHRVLARMTDHFGPHDVLEQHSFDSDGLVLAAGSSDGYLRVLDATSGALVWGVPAHGYRVLGVRLDASGERIATSSIGGNLRIWSRATGELLEERIGHTAGVPHAAFDATGRWLASASWDGTVKLWDLARSSASVTVDPGWRMGLAIDPAGDRLAVGAWGMRAGPACGLALFDLGSRALGWRRLAKIPRARGWSNAAILAWHPDGSRIVASHHGDELLVWDSEHGEVLDRWPAEKGIIALAFAPDGSMLAAAKDTLRLLDPETGEERGRFPGTHDIMHIAFHPDGAILATSSRDALASVWDVASRTLLAELPVSPGEVKAVAFHPDGERFATAEAEGRVRLWSLSPLATLRTWEGHSADVRDLLFHPDGARLFSASVDATIKVWDPERDLEIATLHGHRAVVDRLALTPDGATLVSQDRSGVVRFWLAPPLE